MRTYSAEEICKRFDISLSSLKTNFKRTNESILKKYGQSLSRVKRDGVTTYKIEVENDKRAQTILQESDTNKYVAKQDLCLMDMDFVVLIGIIMTPMNVFRGSYKGFLEYVKMKPSSNNVAAVRQSLQNLAAADYIGYIADKTCDDYFIAGIYKQTETELRITSDMLDICKELAVKYRKRKWMDLFKCWLGLFVMYSRHKPYTLKDMGALTGLSNYQIREYCKILEEDEIVRTSKAYLDYQHCIGKNVDLNGFYESNRIGIIKEEQA